MKKVVFLCIVALFFFSIPVLSQVPQEKIIISGKEIAERLTRLEEGQKALNKRIDEAIRVLDFSIFYFIKCQDEKLKAFYLHIFDNNFNALSYPGPIREYNQCTY